MGKPRDKKIPSILIADVSDGGKSSITIFHSRARLPLPRSRRKCSPILTHYRSPVFSVAQTRARPVQIGARLSTSIFSIVALPTITGLEIQWDLDIKSFNMTVKIFRSQIIFTNCILPRYITDLQCNSRNTKVPMGLKRPGPTV